MEKKIIVSRCSCQCGGSWSIMEVEAHGAQVMLGCLCHSYLELIQGDTAIEVLISKEELLVLIGELMRNQAKLEARLSRVEEGMEIEIVSSDKPEQSTLSFRRMEP